MQTKTQQQKIQTENAELREEIIYRSGQNINRHKQISS